MGEYLFQAFLVASEFVFFVVGIICYVQWKTVDFLKIVFQKAKMH